jgi:hypothetical protein
MSKEVYSLIDVFLRYGNKNIIKFVFSPNNTATPITYNLNLGVESISPTLYENKSSVDTLYAYNTSANDIRNIYTTFYKPIKTGDELETYSDYLFDVYSYIDGSRQITRKNIYRCVLLTSFDLMGKLGSNSDLNKHYRIRSNNYDKTLNKMFSGVLFDNNGLNENVEFARNIAINHLHSHNVNYVIPQSKIKLSYDLQIKEKLEVKDIPQEVTKMLLRIGKYFDELKKILDYDDSTGFYLYKDVQILCKHEHMLYSGVLPSVMSLECYYKGKCRYCGTELQPYHEYPKETFNRKVYEIIYKFIGIIGEKVNEMDVMIHMFSLSYDIVKQHVPSDIKNYDSYVVIMTALFLVYVINNSENEIIYKETKKQKFIKNAYKLGSLVGWKTNDIEKILSEDGKKYFGEPKTAIELLLSTKYVNRNKHPETNLLSVFSNYVFTDISEFDADKITNQNKELILLFKTNSIYKFVKAIEEYKNKQYSITTFKPNFNKKYNTKLHNFKISVYQHGIVFFELMHEYFCPAVLDNISLYTHEFKNGVCTNCGLKKDGKNYKDVYNKYSENILNYSTAKLFSYDKDYDINQKYSVQQIQKINHTKFINMFDEKEDYKLIMGLNNNLDNMTPEQELKMINIISIYLKIDVEEMIEIQKQDKFFIKRALIFIHNRQLGNIILNMISVFYKIRVFDKIIC